MNQFVDAKGKACPTPVILAKKEIDAGNKAFIVAVDNNIAVQNLTKLAENQNYTVSVKTKENTFLIAFVAKDTPATSESFKKVTGNWALFVGKNYIGEGSEELGASLMKMFFYALSEGEDIPCSILFMNGGVKLPAQDEQVIEHLKTLQEKGAEVLVCGTCLNFFELAGQLQTGSISNMYEIVEKMSRADKVVAL